MSARPHTLFFVPCHPAYFDDDRYTFPEVESMTAFLKQNAIILLKGQEFRWVTEPGQFIGVKFDESAVEFPEDFPEDQKTGARKWFHQEGVTLYKRTMKLANQALWLEQMENAILAAGTNPPNQGAV